MPEEEGKVEEKETEMVVGSEKIMPASDKPIVEKIIQANGSILIYVRGEPYYISYGC